MPPKSKKPEGSTTQAGVINGEQAARLIMVSPERVRQLVKAGYIKMEGRGQYNLVAVVQGYIRFLKDEERRANKVSSDSRVRDARAAEIELRIAEKQRDLVSREEAEETNAYIVGLVNEELNGLPARLTRDIPLRRKYEAEFDGAKARIAKALEVAAECLETGKPLPYTDAENDP